MKYRNMYCALLLFTVLTFSGCAEALLAGKVAGSAIYQNSKAKIENVDLVEGWSFSETYGGFYQVGNRIEIWAFKDRKLIGKTVYNLSLEDYRAMSANQKKAHVRDYFKEQTGYNLDPVESKTAEKPTTPSFTRDIPTTGFAPAPR